MALEKALITNTVTGAKIPVQFNPEEYTQNREINYAQAAIPGLSGPILQFVNGNMQTLEMELFLDTYEEHRVGSAVVNAARSDVRDLTAKITDLMAIQPTTHAPPVLLFTWAKLAFTCVLARASQRYMMFLPDGTPVRARVNVTFNEYRNADLEAKEVKRETSRLLQALHGRRRGNAVLDRRARVRRPAPVARDRHRQRAAIRAQPAHRARSPAAEPALSRPGYREGVLLMDRAQFAPDFSLAIGGQPITAELRGSIEAVRCHTGYEGLDEVEITLANDRLRWLDNPEFSLDTGVTLSLGYAPSPLTQVFDGEVVARRRELPRQRRSQVHRDRPGPPPPHERRQEGALVRDPAALPRQSSRCPTSRPPRLVTLENLMVPIFDPVGAALSVILGGVDTIVADHRSRFGAEGDPQAGQRERLRLPRPHRRRERLGHASSSTTAPLGGHLLHFTSSLDHLDADFTLRLRPFADRVHATHHQGRADLLGRRLRVDAAHQDDLQRGARLRLGPDEPHARDLSGHHAAQHDAGRLPHRGAAHADARSRASSWPS